MARQVVVVTDGQVTSTDAVLAFVRKHEAYARVFTFWIGAGPSHHLVRGLARAGGGTAEFILPGERASTKVTRQLARVLSPALTNVRLDCPPRGPVLARRGPRRARARVIGAADPVTPSQLS